MNGVAVEWGAATAALPGESECGDQCVVETFEHGAMVAVIDALGHGREAAHAARLAAQTLSQNPRSAPAALIERCHARLRGTRGAAVSIGAIDLATQSLAWIGIGNVLGTLVSANPRATPRVRELLRYSGVVGDHLRELTPSVVPIAAGDVLILTTDGVGDYSGETLPPAFEPQWLADQLLRRFAKRTDDAGVLVVSVRRSR